MNGSQEALMQMLQQLVISLVESGKLDPTDYAARLAAWHTSCSQPGSLEEAQVWRMLSMLVDDPDVLLRRSAFRVVPGAAIH